MAASEGCLHMCRGTSKIKESALSWHKHQHLSAACTCMAPPLAIRGCSPVGGSKRLATWQPSLELYLSLASKADCCSPEYLNLSAVHLQCLAQQQQTVTFQNLASPSPWLCRLHTLRQTSAGHKGHCLVRPCTVMHSQHNCIGSNGKSSFLL